ncbi:MAG: tRNA (adenosine(37)-N6)-threonylcarbamoyltransferase complex dimerization subunit type 1 TsaB [Eubacterium sp.]|nr:tRNA (adenosine(37)-N6)-threonylcarbamoyltransferase complex dimerization subunit type 1 TsaB [Eubacterium sp.]
MKILAVDTSTIVATAAVVSEEKLICETVVNYKKKHSEKLLPAIDHMLADAGLTIQEMDAFAIVSGPGSFTGLRIGMATVKGFAQALNKPVVTVSTLEALAYNLPYASGVVCPILDAQRDQVYTGIYRFDLQGEMTCELEDSVMSASELMGILENYADAPIYLLGDGVPRFYDTIAEAIPVIKVLPHLSMNRASSAGMLAVKRALAGETTDYKSAELTYIRPSYAEEHKQ